MTGIQEFFQGRKVPKASDGGLSRAVGQILNKPSPPTTEAPPLKQESTPPITVSIRMPLPFEKLVADGAKWSDALRSLFRASSIPDLTFSDADEWALGYNGFGREAKIEFWSHLFAKTMKYECDYNPKSYCVDVGNKNDKNTWSVGLLQLSVVDQKNYGFDLGYSFADLQDPFKNMILGVRIAEKLLLQDRKIAGKVDGSWKGLSRYWGTLREGRTSYVGIKDYVSGLKFSATPTPINKNETPWMDWMRKREGWSETKNDKELSVFWKYTNVPEYKTVVGSDHAWCSMLANAALIESGFKGTHDAAAVSWRNYGTPCGFIFGSILPITHTSGGHHVTFFHHWVDEKNRVAACFGGNQKDALILETYDLSGNRNGHDEVIPCPRWPVKA